MLGSFSNSCQDTELCSGPRGPEECGSVTPSRRLGQARTRAHRGRRPLYRCQPQGRPQLKASSEREPEDVRAVALERTEAAGPLSAREAAPHCWCLRKRLLWAEVPPGHRTAEWALCQSFKGPDREFLIQTSEIDTSLHSKGCECIKKGGACLKCHQCVKEALGVR